MYPAEPATFLNICASIRRLRGHHFEVLCNDYLKARFPNLSPLTSTNVEWTEAGTPDAFFLDDAGALVACQYGATDNWRHKLFGSEKHEGDASKVARLARAGHLRVEQLVFCTTAELNVLDIATAEDEVKTRFGFRAEICDLRRIADDLEKLYPGVAARRLGLRLPLRHFLTLNDYLNFPSRRRWPHQHDLDRELLYVPDSYIQQIDDALSRWPQCLLVGQHASGKSTLAIAFALQWRDGAATGERQRPDAVGFYLEASTGTTEQLAEEWYRELILNDWQNQLLIIDNIHLAPDTIARFCYLWNLQPPRHTKLVLISTGTDTVDPAHALSDIIESLTDRNNVIRVEARHIYKGVLSAYSRAYCRETPGRYMAVDDELADARLAELLDDRCGRNLTATSALLEAWQECGGRLTNVPEDAALTRIGAWITLSNKRMYQALACLAQFEVPVHERFVAKLDVAAIETARRDGFVTVADEASAGRCYRLDLHPASATQLFRACVRLEHGAGWEERVDEAALLILREYLILSPPNGLQVYHRLKQEGQSDLLARLLVDQQLQVVATAQVRHRPLREMSVYLRQLAAADHSMARGLVMEIVPELERRWHELTGTDFIHTANTLLRIEPDVTKSLFGRLTPEEAAKHLTQSPRMIVSWIMPRAFSPAQQLGYSAEWQRLTFECLDPADLAALVRPIRPQPLMWILRAFGIVDKTHAGRVVESLSAEWLGHHFSDASPSVISTFVWLVKRLELDHTFQQRLTTALELQPNRFAAGATLAQLKIVLRAYDLQSAKEFVRRIPRTTIVAMLAEERLSRVGSLIEYHYAFFDAHYRMFASRYLKSRLAQSSLYEAGVFLARIRRTRNQGFQLAQQAFGLLMQCDIRQKLATEDIATFAIIMHNMSDIRGDFPEQLLKKVETGDTLRAAIGKSGFRGVALFVKNVAQYTERPQAWIVRQLSDFDFGERIATASFDDMAEFLWASSGGLTEATLYSISKQIDRTISEEQIGREELRAFLILLWNIVQVGYVDDLHALRQRVVWSRLDESWETDPAALGVCGLLRFNSDPAVEAGVFDSFLRLRTPPAAIGPWIHELADQNRLADLALLVLGLDVVGGGDSTITARTLSLEQRERGIAALRAREATIRTESSRSLFKTATQLLENGES